MSLLPPTGPLKISHKKMATEGGRIDFMFIAPLPHPLGGSATVDHLNLCLIKLNFQNLLTKTPLPKN